jgi:hypothetical protein
MTRTEGLTVLVIGFVICAAISIPLLGGCTDPEGAKRVLRQQGYSNVEITGWRPFSSGKDDSFSTGFSATAPNGERVTGTVSSDWFKGSTVRLD